MVTCTGLSSTANANFAIQLFQGGSVDTGSVYDSYLSFYSADDGGGGGSTNKQTNNSTMIFSDEFGEEAENTGNFILYIFDPSNTATDTRLGGNIYYSRGDTTTKASFTGRIEETAAVDGIRFKFLSGNIDGGQFKLYGIN